MSKRTAYWKCLNNIRMDCCKQILKVTNDGKIQLDEGKLSTLLSRGSKKSKVVTIFGTTRGGKSYIMNAIRKKIINECGNGLNGFTSYIGARSVTKGFWSMECFKGSNKSLSYLLCDTEGAFEMGNKNEVSEKLLALSATISSCLIINVERQLTASELNFFNAFLMHANLEKSNKFNQLLFLVRDWSNPHEYKFGLQGGKEYLKSVKNTKILQNIMNMFATTDCFLMPSIGTEQTRSPNFSNQFRVAKDRLEGYENGEVVTQEFNNHLNSLAKFIENNVRDTVESKSFKFQIKKLVEIFNNSEQISIYDLQEANEKIIDLKKQSEKEIESFEERQEELRKYFQHLLAQSEERERELQRNLQGVREENSQTKREMEALANNVNQLQNEKKSIENKIEEFEINNRKTNEYIEFMEKNNEELREVNAEFEAKCEELSGKAKKSSPGLLKKIANVIGVVAEHFLNQAAATAFPRLAYPDIHKQLNN